MNRRLDRSAAAGWVFTVSSLVLALAFAAAASAAEENMFQEAAPGFYPLREPGASRVAAKLVFQNTTWLLRAETLEPPPPGGCRGIWGRQPWDLWLVEVFPGDAPIAHVNNSLGAPLRREYSEGPLAAGRHWVLVARAGQRYYCMGWRLGGPLELVLNVTVPRDAVLRITAAQVGGWSSVDEEYYDSYLVVKIVKGGEVLEEKRFLLGGERGGWMTLNVSLEPYAGEQVSIVLSPLAGGTVRACKFCTGSWDREFIGIDRVEILSHGKPVLVEEFAPPPGGPEAVLLEAGGGAATTTTTARTEATARTTTRSSTPAQTATITTTRAEATASQRPTTPATPTATTAQTTGRAPPLPVKNGDRISYTVRVKAEGPEGALDASGRLELEARLEDGTLTLVPVETSISGDAAAGAVAARVSDLALLMLGFSSRYRLPGLEPLQGGDCPVLAPGSREPRQGSTEVAPGLEARYRCSYSGGVLTNLEARLEGVYKGSRIYLELQARLEETTIEGVERPSGGGGSSALLPAAALAAAAAAAVAVLLARRRGRG